MHTAYDLISLAAEQTPHHLALVDDRTDRTLTYEALLAEVDAIAAGLAERGVSAGDRVATALPNLWEHCLALLALQRLAAVPTLLNYRLAPEQLAALVSEGGMVGAIVRSEPGAVRSVAAALPSTKLLFGIGSGAEQAHDFSSCRGNPRKLPALPKPNPDDTAFIFYTSGTTGYPKGALIPHRANEARILWLSTYAGLRCGPHLRTLGVSPLSHAIGFYGTFLVTLAYGGTFYTMSAFDAAQAIDQIETRRITYLFSVPTVFQAIISSPNYQPRRLASLELAVYGGASMAEGLLARLAAEWPCPIRNAYGTTETMCALHHPDPVGNARMLRPGYGARVRVVRCRGKVTDVVEPGVAGELIVDSRGDSVFTGYLDPAVTAGKLHDGWYLTGDVFVPHRNGDLELIGRVDDMIRCGGESIYPEEVESVLVACPGVREACVTGIPDPLWGDLVVACVVREDARLSWRDLDAFCLASSLAGFKRPRAYFFVGSLPRNASNKVQRHLVRENIVSMRYADSKAFEHVAA